MGKPFSSSDMLLVSLLLFVGAAVPTYAQSSTSKIEQLVRAKGKPFKINRVSAEYLDLGKAEVPVLQQPLTDAAGNWHSANLVSDHTIVLMFRPASKTHAIYWRLTPSGEIAQSVYGTIGANAVQNRVPNSCYAEQFRAERKFWDGQKP